MENNKYGIVNLETGEIIDDLSKSLSFHNALLKAYESNEDSNVVIAYIRHYQLMLKSFIDSHYDKMKEIVTTIKLDSGSITVDTKGNIKKQKEDNPLTKRFDDVYVPKKKTYDKPVSNKFKMTDTLTIGKYKGKKVSECPASYIKWMKEVGMLY